MSAMKFEEGLEIEVGKAIPVGHKEGVAAHKILQASYPSARQRVQASVDQSHLPVGHDRVRDLARSIFQIEKEVAVVDAKVVKVLFDHLALVSAGDEEVFEAVAGVELHDVPQDRLAADLDHGFRAGGGFLGQTRAQSSGENDHFHSISARLDGASLCFNR